MLLKGQLEVDNSQAEQDPTKTKGNGGRRNGDNKRNKTARVECLPCARPWCWPWPAPSHCALPITRWGSALVTPGLEKQCCVSDCSGNSRLNYFNQSSCDQEPPSSGRLTFPPWMPQEGHWSLTWGSATPCWAPFPAVCTSAPDACGFMRYCRESEKFTEVGEVWMERKQVTYAALGKSHLHSGKTLGFVAALGGGVTHIPVSNLSLVLCK